MHRTVTINASSYEITLTGHDCKSDFFFEDMCIFLQYFTAVEDPCTPFVRYLHTRDARLRVTSELWLRLDGSVPTFSLVQESAEGSYPSGCKCRRPFNACWRRDAARRSVRRTTTFRRRDASKVLLKKPMGRGLPSMI